MGFTITEIKDLLQMKCAKLIILNGASGSGKTFAMEKMEEVSKNIQPIKKYTTRGPRSHEEIDSSIDLVFNTTLEEILECKYHYSYWEEEYGIMADEIEMALKECKSPVIIVRDYETIIDLLRDYTDAIVLYVHSAYTGKELVRILKENGREDIDAADRELREIENFADYMKYLEKDLFCHHIYNYYNDTFVQQLKYYLSKHVEV